jgi:hypothetical protein
MSHTLHYAQTPMSIEKQNRVRVIVTLRHDDGTISKVVKQGADARECIGRALDVHDAALGHGWTVVGCKELDPDE